MLLGEYSVIYKILSSILLGGVVKILDDYLDDDANYEFINLSINKGVLPYCLMIFALSAAFNDEYAVTLFSSCYIVGMFHDFNLALPSKLKSYHEIIIVIILNALLYNLLSIITSLLVILLIQFVDDIRDIKWDKKYGFKNFALKFGKIETILLSLIIFIVLILSDMEKAFIVLGSYIFIDFLFNKKQSL